MTKAIIQQPSTLYGWTLRQWANAAAILDRQPSSHQEALELHRDWHTSRPYGPSDEQLIKTIGGDKRSFDFESALRIFMLG